MLNLRKSQTACVPMSGNFKIWLYKIRVIFDFLLQGKILVLLKKIRLHFKKRRLFLGQMGKAVRLSLFTSYLNTSHPIILIIDHFLGGGANFYRDQKIDQLLANDTTVILLLNDPLSSTFIICYIPPNKRRFYAKIKQFEQFLNLCSLLTISEIQLNNCVSYANATTLPLALVDLKKKKNSKLSLFLHDFFWICPSYNLLNAQGNFCGIPNDLEICRNCLKENKGHFTQLLPNYDIYSWRKNWQFCLNEADSIYCFSQNSRELLLKAYPYLKKDKILLNPHQVDYIHYKPELKQQTCLHIGIVGNINRPEKGRDLVLDMIKLIETLQLPIKITIIGNLTNPPKSKALSITGTYQRADLGKILEASFVNLCFFPSIWPETFSYVCEELMNMGVFLAAFNLGAPAERIKNYKQGLLIAPFTAEAALTQLLSFHQSH